MLEAASEVKISKVPPLYRRETGVSALNLGNIPPGTFPNGFVIRSTGVVMLAEFGWGGNHRHKRTEVYLTFGDQFGEGLEVVWMDADGLKHVNRMSSNTDIQAIFVPSYTPHAVINRSSRPALFLEVADSMQTPADIERISVLDKTIIADFNRMKDAADYIRVES